MKSRQSWSEFYSFEVDRATDVAIPPDISQFRSAIVSGALRPATRLPSTRELARRLGVSRSVEPRSLAAEATRDANDRVRGTSRGRSTPHSELTHQLQRAEVSPNDFPRFGREQ